MSHVARSKSGTLHLTGENGWTHGIQGVDVWSIEETPERLREDDKWCGTCLNAEVRQAVDWAEIDYRRAECGEGLFSRSRR